VTARFVGAALALLAGTAFAQGAPSTCGGFKALAVRTPPGWCVGVVATAADGLRMPRTVLWRARRGETDDLLVVDMGNWEPRRGRLLRIEAPAGGPAKVTELLRGLDRPHGLVPAPGGGVYVAETTRILRLPDAVGGKPAVPETLVDGLPAEGRHPIKEIALGPDGLLAINVGAPSDRCEDVKATPVRASGAGLPACPGMDGPRSLASVWTGRLDADGRKLVNLAPLAIGLRNSMALAVHASGTVLQAENNIDLADEQRPPEEINRLVAGGHYGWPGCVGRQVPVPDAAAADCKQTVAPVLLMPAHAAPLHMAFSNLDFGLKQAQGRAGLLVSWHGYRAAGQRLVRYDTRPDGTPYGAPQELIAGWRVPDAHGGTQPGAPVGWSEDAAGRLWIADDRNRMLLVLQRR
jgi:glucose/arabinose dehydrogenase